MNSEEEVLILPPVQDVLEVNGFVPPSAQDALEAIGGLQSAPPPTELIGGTTAPEHPGAKRRKPAKSATPELPEKDTCHPWWLRAWRWLIAALRV